MSLIQEVLASASSSSSATPVVRSVNRASSVQPSGPTPAEAKLDLIALFYRVGPDFPKERTKHLLMLLSLLLQTQHQPKLDASVLLLDIFQSADYFKRLTTLPQAELNKFLKLAQLVRPSPSFFPSFGLARRADLSLHVAMQTPSRLAADTPDPPTLHS